ncbi:MAG: hypothetical protein DHS20C16_13210 [Phycisphaerae bacterium]|nr:MAG: hypothetical protein DHS20C16_13210 [Phycisphaerae bacterium]
MKIDAHIERLIVRKLDGEISESEQLELDRELLRSADVRAIYESYCEIDDLAADVIRTSARGAGDAVSAPVLKVRHEVVARQPRHHKWMIYASGLAACLALVLIWKTPGSDMGGSNTFQPQNSSGNNGWGDPNLARHPVNVDHRNGIPAHEVGIWNVADLPKQRLDRMTNQNLILVPTGDGGYYLMHLDHVRQVRQPKDQAESLRWNRPI